MGNFDLEDLIKEFKIEKISLAEDFMENKLSEKEIEILRKIIKEHENIYNEDNEYKERAEYRENYYYITSGGGIYEEIEDNCEADDDYFEIGNYYFTEEEAKEELEKMKIRAKLKRLAERLNFEKTGKKEITAKEWKNDDITKVVIAYDFGDDVFKNDSNWTYKRDDIYCLDKNFLLKAIEEIGEDELKKLFI